MDQETIQKVRAVAQEALENTVKLCKSTYDVLPGATYEDAQFINIRYRTTTLDALTEAYIC